MGYLKSIGTAIIYISFFLTVITFLPGLPPEAEYSEYSIKFPNDVQNHLELKNRLQGAEILFSGEIKGAEYFASYNGEIYTGVHGGYVVKLEDNRIEPIVKFGQKCDGLWQEERCGRPLGLKFNDKGELFVADAYYGIFKVNVKTRQYINIVNSSEPINGKVPKIVNSLDIAKNGDIYWTDSSTDFELYDGMYSFLANPSGRLIRYNTSTRKNEVLIQNLGFANGVLLSDDESFVIVLESLTSRIIKYNLKGPKTGQHEIFAEALPGLPDNVHSDEQGGFLVSLIQYADPQYPFLPQSLMPHPYIRKMLSRLLYLIEAPFKLLQDIYPNYYAEKFTHVVGSFEVAKFLDVKKTSVILRMDKSGNILDAIYSSDKKVYYICSAFIHNEYLWLGSPWNEYIMRVPLKQAFPDLVANKKSNTKEQSKEEPRLTVSETPNVKVEIKSMNKKSSQEAATKSRPKMAKEQTIQTPNLEASTLKSSTQKPTAQSHLPTTTSTTAAAAAATAATTTTTTTTTTSTTPSTTTSTTPTTTTSTTPTTTPTTTTTSTTPTTTTSTTPTTTTSTTPTPTTATITTTPKPTTVSSSSTSKIPTKQTGKDHLKEVKKDNSNLHAKTETLKQGTASSRKSRSDESAKIDVNDQPMKSKSVEKKSDPNKK